MMEKKIVIELANPCNNNCVFCGAEKKGKSNIEDYEKEIKKAYSDGCISVEFGGSEPTLHPRILKLIYFAKKTGFKTITLVTNGRIFSSKKNIKSFLDFGVNKILFKVYSLNGKVHDKITRVSGSLKQTLNGIEKVIDIGKNGNYNLSTGINLQLSRLNYDNFVHNIDRINKIGVDFISVYPVVPSILGGKHNVVSLKDSFLSDDELRGLEKIKGDKIKFKIFPRCEVWCSSPPSKGIKIVGSDGNIREQIEVIEGYSMKDSRCTRCKFGSCCSGRIKNPDSDSFYTLWCASDLHVSAKKKDIASMIFADVLQNCVFDKGVIAGDFVEGEEDKESYREYKKLINRFGLKSKLIHVAGNHEHIFTDKNYSLREYKNYISKNLVPAEQLGNICLIGLSMDNGPYGIKKETAKYVNEIMKKNKRNIIVVFSHVPKSMLDRYWLLQPDIWVYGHDVLKKNGKVNDCFFSLGTWNIHCGVRELRSKFLVFEDGENKVIVRDRDHRGGRFLEDLEIKIRKEFRA